MKISISTLALIATVGLGLAGCTDDDISYGGGIASGGIIYGDGYYHDHNFPYPGYYPQPGHGGGFGGGHPGGGFGGGNHGGGNPGGGFGGGGMHGGPGGGMGGGGHGGHPVDLVTKIDTSALNASMDATPVSATTFESSDARVQHVAANYSISDYAATYVVRAIVMAQAKDITGLSEIGLTTNDFSDLYNGHELAADKINVVAANLKMPVVAAQALLQDLSSDLQAEQAKQ